MKTQVHDEETGADWIIQIGDQNILISGPNGVLRIPAHVMQSLFAVYSGYRSIKAK